MDPEAPTGSAFFGAATARRSGTEPNATSMRDTAHIDHAGQRETEAAGHVVRDRVHL
jgi:hypothetical protein